MQELHKEGLARAIGVSNFHPDRLVDLIDHNEIVPAVNQIETHPFHQRAADQALMRERGVQDRSPGTIRRGEEQPLSPIRSSAASPRHTASPSRRWCSAGSFSARSSSSPSPSGPNGWPRTSTSSTSPSPTSRMNQIATLDTGASLFFDHRDPAMVSWLGGRRLS